MLKLVLNTVFKLSDNNVNNKMLLKDKCKVIFQQKYTSFERV